MNTMKTQVDCRQNRTLVSGWIVYSVCADEGIAMSLIKFSRKFGPQPIFFKYVINNLDKEGENVFIIITFEGCEKYEIVSDKIEQR